jgi:outer membrane protein assembly factor BamB
MVVVCAALVVCLNAAAAAPPASWTTYGNGSTRAGDASSAAPPTLARDFVLPLEGRIVGQVLAANGTFYAATTAGEVAAFSADGALRWRVDVGQLAQGCQQLDGYGIPGTGVVDEPAGALYVADAFGRLHALDLTTGAEHDGWPLRVFSDFRRELVWGALTLADGAVYVPTASVLRLAVDGRRLSRRPRVS